MIRHDYKHLPRLPVIAQDERSTETRYLTIARHTIFACIGLLLSVISGWLWLCIFYAFG